MHVIVYFTTCMVTLTEISINEKILISLTETKTEMKKLRTKWKWKK